MNNSQITESNQRLDLLSEIAQTPDDYIPNLLEIVRLFRHSMNIKQTSVNAWDNAINQINNNEATQKKQEKIKQLFQSWRELDTENEQKEMLKIIESIESISI
jgi:hypothetical protein